jgi:hypothetical protein
VTGDRGVTGVDVTADLDHLGQVRLSIAGFSQAAATVSRR